MKDLLLNQKDNILGSKNSLRSKIIRDTFFTFLVYFLVLEFVLFLATYFVYDSFALALNILIFSFFIGLFVFFIIALSLRKTFKKNILSRIKKFKKTSLEILDGDYSKRLEITRGDELGDLALFANSVLDQLEKRIEVERKYSLIDPLTLSYNRRALILFFSKLTARVRRGDNVSLSFALFDVDNFEKLKKNYGEKVGEEVLKKITIITKKFLRESDNLYRIGLDEFLITFFDLANSNEKKLIARLQNEIKVKLREAFPQIEEDITVSGGFVNSNKFDLTLDETLDLMIDEADKLLAQAKNSGKKQFLFA